jgi:AraC family transcriptional regulator of adaptative response/methylated-DNA-[protein]-cysteine methyltransferase
MAASRPMSVMLNDTTSIDHRWQAVIRRDAMRDGRFFYAVVTTGVFCRPSCASRLPRPENVRFFDTAEAAMAAGFRPCKRCRPVDPPREERERAAIERACAILRSAETIPSLAELAREVGISRYHFHRLFKKVTGVTPKAYGAARRMDRLRDDLSAGAPVAEAIFGAGFGSLSGAYGVA